MPKKKIDTSRVKVNFESFKRHRAWVSGFEAGSGQMVPFSHELALLHSSIQQLLNDIEKAEKK